MMIPCRSRIRIRNPASIELKVRKYLNYLTVRSLRFALFSGSKLLSNWLCWLFVFGKDCFSQTKDQTLGMTDLLSWQRFILRYHNLPYLTVLDGI